MKSNWPRPDRRGTAAALALASLLLMGNRCSAADDVIRLGIYSDDAARASSQASRIGLTADSGIGATGMGRSIRDWSGAVQVAESSADDAQRVQAQNAYKYLGWSVTCDVIYDNLPYEEGELQAYVIDKAIGFGLEMSDSQAGDLLGKVLDATEDQDQAEEAANACSDLYP